MDTAEDRREPTLQDEVGVPRPRWGAVVAALTVLLCSALATLVISVRITETATPLHAGSDTVTAVVRTARAPGSFQDKPVSVRMGDTRLAGQVRTAATFTSSAAEQAAAGGATSAAPAVLIVVAVSVAPVVPVDLATARIEVDFGRHSLIADLVEGRG